MSALGIARHFPFGACGDDHADRNLLGPLALERAELFHGRGFFPGGGFSRGKRWSSGTPRRTWPAPAPSAPASLPWPPVPFPLLSWRALTRTFPWKTSGRPGPWWNGWRESSIGLQPVGEDGETSASGTTFLSQRRFSCHPRRLQTCATPRRLQTCAAPRRLQTCAAPRRLQTCAAPRRLQTCATPRRLKTCATPRRLKTCATPRRLQTCATPHRLKTCATPHRLKTCATVPRPPRGISGGWLLPAWSGRRWNSCR